jgi:MFS superfamily sulfate permease-like transporter
MHRNAEKYPEAEKIPGIVVVRLDAPLFFANTAHFENNIRRHVKQGQREAHEAGREFELSTAPTAALSVCLTGSGRS